MARKYNFYFDAKRYEEAATKFIFDKLNSKEFKTDVGNIYAREIREAKKVVGMDWWAETVADIAVEWSSAREPKINGDTITITLGIPPSSDRSAYEYESPGTKYWQYAIEYGIGSKGIGHRTGSPKPLMYHKEGEHTWTPAFEDNDWVVEKGKGGNPMTGAKPGDLMPEGMNQEGIHFMKNVEIAIGNYFDACVAYWAVEFKEKHPISDFITNKG